MRLREIALKLGTDNPKKLSGLKLYDHIRRSQLIKFKSLLLKPFQSPSIDPTTHRQRSKFQAESEHSVYQRSDYTPIGTENSLNSIFPPLKTLMPKTLLFNSGMAAISSLAYYLYCSKNIQKLVLGENAYFETKWLLEDYRHCQLIDEYRTEIFPTADAYWFEYPINCTNPLKYPFQEQFDLSRFFTKLLENVSQTSSPVYLVLDYTLCYLPFNLCHFMKVLPENLTIFLITSLQKHRGLGLDLTNAGAITVYSHQLNEVYDYLVRIRAIMGTSITQETTWLMPTLNPQIINQIITDSGLEAKRIYHLIDHPNSAVKFYFADNDQFRTSFIFAQINPSLIKRFSTVPYLSDQLIAELVASAKRHEAILVQGTSFGFPFTRIFKNSERYSNTDSLRIAVGYDPVFNKNLELAILEGVDVFIHKHT